eukprot:m.404329 g.404329  ORF g.404329 m.404329 type:complete len:61 (-) comp21196_c1_seq32:420-602(-)
MSYIRIAFAFSAGVFTIQQPNPVPQQTPTEQVKKPLLIFNKKQSHKLLHTQLPHPGEAQN